MEVLVLMGNFLRPLMFQRLRCCRGRTRQYFWKCFAN